MDQLFHLCHHPRFWRGHIFPICDVDRSAGKLIDHLAQDPHALAHFLNPHQITIITIACTADHHVEIIFVVIEIRVFAPQIVVDPASAQVGAGKGVRNRAHLRYHTDVLGPIDKNFVPGQQPVALVQARPEIVEEFFQLRNEALGQIADLSTHSSVRRGEAGAGEQLEQIIKFFALGKSVEKHGHRAEVERHGAKTHQMRGNPRCFAANRANRFSTRWNFPPHQFFNCQRVGHVV